MDRIFIKGIQLYAYHGVLNAEQKTGQKFLIDVEMFLDLKGAGKTDDLSKTIDYAEVCSLVKQITTQNKFKLIETLAQVIASKIIDCFNVDKVIVCVRKPHAPVNAVIETVGVEIERNKE